MINGFEEETKPLDDFERSLLMPFKKSFERKIGKENAITSAEIIKGIEKSYGKKLGGARIRKIINHLRTEGIVRKLVASSKGYYIANNQDELLEYCTSLEQRSREIMRVAKALRSQL